MGFDAVAEWMLISSPSIPPLERHHRLREAFTQWVRLTRGTPDSVGRLTSLLLQDIFQGIGEDDGQLGVFGGLKGALKSIVGSERHKLIEKVVTGLQFSSQNIFQAPNLKNSSIGQLYAVMLESTFENYWKKREWTGDLIGALRKDGLDYEARCISRINIRKYGTEVVTSLFSNLEGIVELQAKLYGLISEISELDTDQINFLFPDPNARARLKEYCQFYLSHAKTLTKELDDFQQKL